MSDGKEGAHEWIIEFDTSPKDIKLFVQTLDNQLRILNSDYDAKRQNNLALRLPIVHVVGKRFFYEWMKSQNKLGRQYKVPRLANHRNHLESIFKFKETMNS
jgi:hypothetical protein